MMAEPVVPGASSASSILNPNCRFIGGSCNYSNYSTKEECEAAVDSDGNPKKAGIFDNKCEQDSDCPFYLGNTNYENTRGGCKEGYCEMPVNVKLFGYKEFSDTADAVCYNCNN